MFNFEKISSTRLYVAPTSERVVEFSPEDIDVSNVARVLSLAVAAKCSGVDVFDGYVQVGGRVNFRLVYLDKEGAAKGVDYNADFSARVDGDFSDGESVMCEAVVAESEVQAGDTLTLTAVLELKASAIKHEEIDALIGADDCYVTKKDIIVPKYIAQKSITVPFDDERNVGAEIDSILSLSTTCIAKQAKATDGGVSARLNLIARVTYVENERICTQDFNIPLEEEITLDGVEEGDEIMLSCAVKNAKIVLQGVTDDNVIRLEGEAQIRFQAFRCEQTQVISDLFMLTNDTLVEQGRANYECFDGCGYFVESVNGIAPLLDNKPAAIEVSALPYARCYTSRAYVDENSRLVVEGVINTDIIYKDENGYNSARAEIPFSLALASETPFLKDVSVKCLVQNVSAQVKRDREFEVSADIAVKVCGYSSFELEYISNVEVGNERAQNTSGLSVYVASGTDTMLDVCKALSAMPEDIMAQNPDLTLPFMDDTRIIYFRAIK